MTENEQNTFNNALLKEQFGRWGAYAAAAGAALALTTSAEAEIVYSGPQNVVVNQSNGEGLFDIGGDHGRITFQSNASHRAFGVGGGEPVVVFATSGHAKFFQAGQLISGASLNSSGQLRGANGTPMQATHAAGLWGPGTVTGFVGGVASNGDDYWVQVKVQSNAAGYPTEAEIIDWAYNDAGGPITAGEGIPASATPEPGMAALGLLASGTAGLLAWRRKRGTLRTF